jgi:hypothetical protein
MAATGFNRAAGFSEFFYLGVKTTVNKPNFNPVINLI